MDKVIELLISNGWTEDGRTREETVRHVDGLGRPKKTVTYGGRARFAGPGIHKCTVGKRTINFYEQEDGVVTNFRQFMTYDLEGIKGYLQSLQEESVSDCSGDHADVS